MPKRNVGEIVERNQAKDLDKIFETLSFKTMGIFHF